MPIDIFPCRFTLPRRALDVVRQDTSKSSLSIKLKRVGWDEGFLCSILTNIAKA